MSAALVTPHLAATVASLLLTPFGIAFFGIFGLFAIFGPVLLILLVASLVGGRSRTTGDPSGFGILAGIGFLIVLTVAIDAAMR